MKDKFIVACQEYFVKQQGERRAQQRQIRETLPEDAITRRLRILAKIIARCERRHQPVRIPALNGAEWGQVLRTLELKRAYA
jgi:ppGpp synthetase/RelA/SpoT-type nucleotidyltranferase